MGRSTLRFSFSFVITCTAILPQSLFLYTTVIHDTRPLPYTTIRSAHVKNLPFPFADATQSGIIERYSNFCRADYELRILAQMDRCIIGTMPSCDSLQTLPLVDHHFIQCHDLFPEPRILILEERLQEKHFFQNTHYFSWI